MRLSTITFWLYSQACILGLALFAFNTTDHPASEHSAVQEKVAHKTTKPFEIGVLIFAHSTMTTKLIDEFKRWFNAHSPRPCNVHVHSANENYMTLDIMAQKLLLSKYDLIWAAGFQPVQTIAHKLTKEAPAAPILVSSISKDMLDELREQNPLFSRCVTGWYGSYDWNLRVTLLSTLLPHAKNALFFYHTSRQPLYLRDMQAELMRHDIRCTEIAITDAGDALNYVRTHAHEIDIIIVMRESGLVPVIDHLISLANKQRIPLFASDIDSVYKGAACGVCSDENTFGRYSAWFAKKLLVDGYKPYKLPFIEIKDWSVRAVVNGPALALQNAHVPKNILFLMKQSFAYHCATISEE